MNLLNSGLWGIGSTLVDMRQRKLLKRFAATPMRHSDYLLALTSSRLIFMLLEVVIFLGFGFAFFQMPVHGSPITILLLCTIGSTCFSGLGLLTASRAQKQRECQRINQSCHDANVDFVRGILLV